MLLLRHLIHCALMHPRPALPCPAPVQLLTERPAAPQLAGPAVEQARGSFFDARQAMLANKLRSYDSSGIFGSRRP